MQWSAEEIYTNIACPNLLSLWKGAMHLVFYRVVLSSPPKVIPFLSRIRNTHVPASSFFTSPLIWIFFLFSWPLCPKILHVRRVNLF